MLDDRETVSPATPGRPVDRATPVVLSGGALSVGVPASGRLVSKARSSPVALHELSIAAVRAVAAVARWIFI